VLAIALFGVTLLLTLIHSSSSSGGCPMSVEPITLRGTELSARRGWRSKPLAGKRARRLRIFGRYVALSVLAVRRAVPIYITIVSSLLQPSQIAAKSATFFPTSPQGIPTPTSWNAGHLATYLRNSFIQTGLSSPVSW